MSLTLHASITKKAQTLKGSLEAGLLFERAGLVLVVVGGNSRLGSLAPPEHRQEDEPAPELASGHRSSVFFPFVITYLSLKLFYFRAHETKPNKTNRHTRGRSIVETQPPRASFCFDRCSTAVGMGTRALDIHKYSLSSIYLKWRHGFTRGSRLPSWISKI